MLDSWGVEVGIGPGRPAREARWAAERLFRRRDRIPDGRTLLKVREDWSPFVANTGVGMGRGLWAGLVALGLLAACSSGGGSAAKTTTTSTTTSTTAPTTTTTAPEDAVKAAYLDYWKMVDRLAAAPDPDDPELAQRAMDPVLSDVLNDISTRKAQGPHDSTSRDARNTPTTCQRRPVDRQRRNCSTTASSMAEFSSARRHRRRTTRLDDRERHRTLVKAAGDWKVSDVQFHKNRRGDIGLRRLASPRRVIARGPTPAQRMCDDGGGMATIRRAIRLSMCRRRARIRSARLAVPVRSSATSTTSSTCTSAPTSSPSASSRSTTRSRARVTCSSATPCRAATSTWSRSSRTNRA